MWYNPELKETIQQIAKNLFPNQINFQKIFYKGFRYGDKFNEIKRKTDNEFKEINKILDLEKENYELKREIHYLKELLNIEKKEEQNEINQ